MFEKALEIQPEHLLAGHGKDLIEQSMNDTEN